MTRPSTGSHLCLGVDPGLSGGFALFDPSLNRVVLADRLPTYSVRTTGTRQLSMIASRDLISALSPHPIAHIGIEDAYGRRGDGPAGSFTFGGVWWVLYEALRGLGVPISVIPPKDWQRSIIGPWKGMAPVIGANGKPTTARERSKAASIAHVRHLYPDVDLTPGRLSQPHDGIADAVGLAIYTSMLVASSHASIRDMPPRTARRPARRRA